MVDTNIYRLWQAYTVLKISDKLISIRNTFPYFTQKLKSVTGVKKSDLNARWKEGVDATNAKLKADLEKLTSQITMETESMAQWKTDVERNHENLKQELNLMDKNVRLSSHRASACDSSILETETISYSDLCCSFVNTLRNFEHRLLSQLFTLSLSHPLTCSPAYLFTLSLVHPLTCSPSHLFTLSHVHPLTCSPSHLFTLSLVHPLTCSPSHLFTLSLVHPLTCSPAHLLTLSLAHTLTCSPSHLFTLSLVHPLMCLLHVPIFDYSACQLSFINLLC